MFDLLSNSDCLLFVRYSNMYTVPILCSGGNLPVLTSSRAVSVLAIEIEYKCLSSDKYACADIKTFGGSGCVCPLQLPCSINLPNNTKQYLSLCQFSGKTGKRKTNLVLMS